MNINYCPNCGVKITGKVGRDLSISKGSERNQLLNKIKRMIEETKEEGIAAYLVGKRIQSFPAQTINGILDELVESGAIRKERVPNGKGRHGFRYYRAST